MAEQACLETISTQKIKNKKKKSIFQHKLSSSSIRCCVVFIVVLFCCRDSCFPLEESTVFGFGFDTLLIVGLLSDVCSAFSGAAIFGWLVLCGIAVGCAQFCYHFAFFTVSCGTFTQPDHLLDPFLILCFTLSTIFVWFGLPLESSLLFFNFQNDHVFFLLIISG
jgi:hypothetical protein